MKKTSNIFGMRLDTIGLCPLAKRDVACFSEHSISPPVEKFAKLAKKDAVVYVMDSI